MSNPFEFEYDEMSNIITTKYNIKFYRENENIDRTKSYIKIDFSIYKNDNKVDYFTWLNNPDPEINFHLELYFELNMDLNNLLIEKFIEINNYYGTSDDKKFNFFETEKLNYNDFWFECWYKKSKYATDKINLLDTYIPTNIEIIQI